MEEKKLEPNKQKKVPGVIKWGVIIALFGQITGWIGGPVLISLFLGKYLDKKYDTTPWIFLSLTALAFLISMFGIIKTSLKYMKDIESNSKNTNTEINEPNN